MFKETMVKKIWSGTENDVKEPRRWGDELNTILTNSKFFFWATNEKEKDPLMFWVMKELWKKILANA